MQQDNNIQNKLQQLENQQLPDLSHMDEHWQQMRAMLQTPGSTGGKLVNMNRWFWIMTGIAFIAAVIFITTHFANKKNDEKLTTETTEQNKIQDDKIMPANISSATPNNSISDSTSINSLADEKITAGIKKASIIRTTKQPVVAGRIDLPVKLDSNTSTIKTIEPNKQLLLDNLLTELAKKAQEFTIDNRRDTLLTADEGSSLFIPANSLGGSNEVKISLKEYYKASDIILNKLSTTSNGNQLVTGGMINITATANGQPVSLQPNNAIRLYLPDTSSERMKQMQLFVGENILANTNKVKTEIGERETRIDYAENSPSVSGNNFEQINWIPRNQYFTKIISDTLVRVLDLRDVWIEIDGDTTDLKNATAYFVISDNSKLTRQELKLLMKKRYGYGKVRIRHSWKKVFVKDENYVERKEAAKNLDFAIGDSTWMEKWEADKYGLVPTATRINRVNDYISSSNSNINNMLSYIQHDPTAVKTKQDIFNKLQTKYFVDVNSLGWINCDHFLNRSKLVEYAVNLNDSAANYYTMLVFTNIKSMMSGYLSGDKVTFENVPEGEPVKIVSIGINKNGQPIMAIKETTIHKEEETGLQFEQVAAGNIKSSLSKMDTAP